jgi:predicted dinucleotide-binding enzyme
MPDRSRSGSDAAQESKGDFAMNVGIVGAGNMARGIGTRLVEGGNAVTFFDTDADKARGLAAELEVRKAGGKATAGTLDRALANPVVVLALPFAAAQDFAREHSVELAGKIVVDISNPLNATYDGLVTHPGKSAAEEIAVLLPTSKVVKAFNTTFAGTLVAGEVSGHKLDVLIAGDDREAKRTVIELVESGGLRGIDAGKLERARHLEGLGLLGITLQSTLGTGFQSAWKLVA